MFVYMGMRERDRERWKEIETEKERRNEGERVIGTFLVEGHLGRCSYEVST